jgi:hypothetical protein
MARIFNASTGVRPTGWTISRTSTATYLNASGVIATATANAERLNYNASATLLGLLIEPAATNLVLQGESMSTTPWATFINGSGTISETANAATAPDGTTTATLISLNRSLVSDYAEHYQVTTSGAGTFVHSVWFKGNAAGDVGKTVQICIYDGTTVTGKNVTLTAAWQRVDFSAVAAASIQAIVGYVANTGLASSSGTGAVGLLAWGDQAETGTVPTSLIPTTTATATRAADDYSFTLAAGATQLTYTFDDASTQVVTGLTGGSTYHIPTNLARANVLYIDDNSAAGGGAGSSAGTGSVTGQGAATSAAAGSSAGLGAATAGGAWTVAAPGTSAGAGAATGAANTTVSGAGTSAGVGAASGAGASSAAGQGAGSSAGVAAVSGAGTAINAAAGSSAGLGFAAAGGFSQATVTSTGSVSGVGVAAAVAPIYQALAAAGLSFGTGAAFGTPFVAIPVIIGTGNRLLTPLVTIDHDVLGYKPGYKSTGSNSSARGREAPARRPYAETWD